MGAASGTMAGLPPAFERGPGPHLRRRALVGAGNGVPSRHSLVGACARRWAPPKLNPASQVGGIQAADTIRRVVAIRRVGVACRVTGCSFGLAEPSPPNADYLPLVLGVAWRRDFACKRSYIVAKSLPHDHTPRPLPLSALGGLGSACHKLSSRHIATTPRRNYLLSRSIVPRLLGCEHCPGWDPVFIHNLLLCPFDDMGGHIAAGHNEVM